MTSQQKKVRTMTQLSFLIAIMAILTFTPLGFIMLPTGAITVMHIPVIMGGILMGPLYGGILGGAFGIFSMIKATIAAASPVDLLFTPVASGNPLASIVMTVVPRILLGVIAGYLYLLLRKTDPKNIWSIPVTAGIAACCHTVMVLGCLSLFFNTITIVEVFATLVALNGTLELLGAVIIVTALCRPLMAYLKRE